MADYYLTQKDVQDYGTELIDLTQRSALHAIAPHLANLEQQNAELQRRLAKEARHRLDQQVERMVPDLWEVDKDPEWRSWLAGVDTLSGRMRQQLLNDAIASTDANRVAEFFRKFQREAGGSQSHASARAAPGRRQASSGRQIYTRPQVAALYEAHRKGAYVGREQEWARQEHDIIAAGREGRIVGGTDVAGK
jgi:hypothetical protein